MNQRDMTKKPTVTIGIPAYNEEANIGFLLKDLMDQKNDNYKLEKIIVSSDGSTDNTVRVVKRFDNKKIKVIVGRTRRGNANSQNKIIKHSRSAVLVLLNADIRIRDRHFLQKLIEPISRGNVDLAAAFLQEVTPSNFFEKMLSVSVQLKKDVFEKYKSGNNLHTCHGVARALSRRFYKQLKFRTSFGEDAYTYLFCIWLNYQYRFVKRAVVYYKLPDNLLDHQRQSMRYFQSKEKFFEEFGEDFVRKHYYLPINLLLKALFYFVMRYPAYTILYLIVLGYMKVKSKLEVKIKDNWEIAQSTKKLG